MRFNWYDISIVIIFFQYFIVGPFSSSYQKITKKADEVDLKKIVSGKKISEVSADIALPDGRPTEKKPRN